MEKRIKVTIDPMGNVKYDVEGFTGGACVEATASLEAALMGGKGIDVREHKPSFFDAESDQEEHQHVKF